MWHGKLTFKYDGETEDYLFQREGFLSLMSDVLEEFDNRCNLDGGLPWEGVLEEVFDSLKRISVLVDDGSARITDNCVGMDGEGFILSVEWVPRKQEKLPKVEDIRRMEI